MRIIRNNSGNNYREKVNRRGLNRWRKDIKVTLVTFGLHAGRFTVECAEYENTLFSYFDIFIYFPSNFALDSTIAEYLHCHIGLQFHICLLILILLSFEKIEKKNVSSNTCFEPNPRCFKLFAFK